MFMVDLSGGNNALLIRRPTWPKLVTRLLIFGPATVVLIRRVHDAVGDLKSLSGWNSLHAAHLDAFQLLAWGVAFYLLSQLRQDRIPNSSDIASAIIVGLIGTFSSTAGLAALSLFLFVSAAGDVQRRAVATVFAALFVHQAVVPIVYDLMVDKVTQFDAMLVGTAVKLTVAGSAWHDNIITVPSGHAIEIMKACCSFHNVSMSALSWVALTKLERPQWRRSNLAVLASAAGCQILLNTIRIYLMAQSFEMYDYWHNGAGAGIYSVCASAAAVLISAYGAHLVSLGAANRTR